MKTDFEYQQNLLKKQYEGEKNVFTTKIASLEKTVKEQDLQITSLADKLENAYAKIQSVAEKAIEGAAAKQSALNLQQAMQNQNKKGE
ncbi:MAG TPA: hypothetical protein ENL20_08615 [Candidatus Cloacimonetes bacterium]|nr:hypothetical protein [Candidatus Cloacimonadota bacterium]